MSPRARDANLDLLKWLAMLSMLLDHLRYVWPQSEWLFIVGRLAFPLFCLGIAAMSHARNREPCTPRIMFVTWAGWRRLP